MTQSSHFADIEAIHQLLTSYSFEVEPYQTKAIVAGWLAEFGPIWVSHAITEALYQGRYKLISIDQILKLWKRRGQPIRHFNREFESIILGQTLLYSTGYGDGPEPSTLRRTATSASLKTPPQSAPPAPEPALSIAESDQAEPDQVDLTGQDIAAAAQGTPSAPDAVRGAKDAEESAIHEAVPDFRPVAADGSSRWQQLEVIQPFVPRRDGSELHERLLAVVQGGMQE